MACAIIHRTRDGMREILIGKNPAAPYEDRWSFPGGPVEPGEPPEAALRRALRSTLGLAVDVQWGQPPFDQAWDGVPTRWRYFFCEHPGGEVHNTHYREVRWVPDGALREYEYDPVSQQVVDWILEDRR